MKLKIFIGYDSREDIAFEVAKASILQHTDAEVLALRLDDLRDQQLAEITFFLLKMESQENHANRNNNLRNHNTDRRCIPHRAWLIHMAVNRFIQRDEP